MDLQQAYSILGIPITTSEEDTKKAYRELAKKFHPDVNKETDAESRIKKINEAYNYIVNSQDQQEQDIHIPFEGFNPFSSFVNRARQIENIPLYTTISFAESVLGCKKEFRFNRRGKCANCHGQGMVALNNNCIKCHGRGQIIEKQGNMIITRTCDQCIGRRQTISCSVCQSTGSIDTEVSITVTIPGGIQNDNILRLSGMGHYIGNVMNIDQYADAHLKISVTPEENLSLDNNDVISNIDITLLEALTGTTKSVKTIIGEKEIIIPSLSKNKDEAVIPGMGVSGKGCQRVIINIVYPENKELIDNIIDMLSDHNKN